MVNGVYKLVARGQGGRWRGVWKRSADKSTVPWPKQVFRRSGEGGTMEGDVIGAADEELAGEPLLAPAMRGGEIVRANPSRRYASAPQRSSRRFRKASGAPQASTARPIR